MKTKKIYFIIILLSALFFFNSCSMLFDPEASSASTVYVTSSGHAYHRSSCGSIKHSRHIYSMSKGEAEGKGYNRCSKCKP